MLTSILTCDQTPGVPHFWHKKLMEDRLVDLGVPFVALRPGAFLDQVTRFGGDPVAEIAGRLTGGPIRVRSVPMPILRTAGSSEYSGTRCGADSRSVLSGAGARVARLGCGRRGHLLPAPMSRRGRK